MSGVHKDVILEALSALTGTRFKETGIDNEQNILHFITTSFMGLSPAVCSSVLQPSDDFDGGFLHELSVNIEQLLDPKFDYDLTHLKDDKLRYERGGEQYNRPYGWNRIALKVLDKYPDGNVWLGPNEFRTRSVKGEWPVSYHGTTIEGATGITESHYKPGKRQVHGRGIYSTPDIKVACSFSKQFRSKTDGKTYKVLLQNRINPQIRTVCKRKDYWLIEIPEDTPPDEEKKIVEKSIRPYGILLKEVK